MRYAAPTSTPGRAQSIGKDVVPTPTGIGIGKQTHSMGLSQRYRRFTQNTSPPTSADGNFDHLFHSDENGTRIVQFARLHALERAVQLINYFDESPEAFTPHFDVWTESIAISEINGLPSSTDAWKARYRDHKIRIRIEGTFIGLANPQVFLVTMSIVGLVGADIEKNYKPVFNEVIGFLKLKSPRVVPPPDRDAPSVSPESADQSG